MLPVCSLTVFSVVIGVLLIFYSIKIRIREDREDKRIKIQVQQK
jgi:hypothetical protein